MMNKNVVFVSRNQRKTKRTKSKQHKEKWYEKNRI